MISDAAMTSPKPGESDNESIDPLDAFMKEVDQVVEENERKAKSKVTQSEKEVQEYENEIETTQDSSQDYTTGTSSAWEAYNQSVEEIHTDSTWDNADREKLLLPKVDHSRRNYEPFKKVFMSYENTTEDKNAALSYRKELSIRMWKNRGGFQAAGHSDKLDDFPPPLRSFMDAGFDPTLLRGIAKCGFEEPTPIQRQSIPAIMSGLDVIGLAETGSGKTLAFVWPMLVHLMDQPELVRGDGPIAIVLTPTRELAHQIYLETKRFAKLYRCKVCPVYGGVSKWDQTKMLKGLCEVVVGTPGRVIDLVKSKALVMKRVTYLVVDEADLMFSHGFEPQILTVVDHTRPDRQTILFSATFNQRVKHLTRTVMTDPVCISVGKVGGASASVSQTPVVLATHEDKWTWLVEHIEAFCANGKVLIFVGTKQGCQQLHDNLRKVVSRDVMALHGDLSQPARSDVVKRFRQGATGAVLVGTDVAARGLDIKDVNTVVCYDAARNIDTHVHRIGRTGRMTRQGAQSGAAFALVTHRERAFALDLSRSMRQAGQHVPPDLARLAAPSRKRQRASGRSDVWRRADRFLGLGGGQRRGAEGPPAFRESEEPPVFRETRIPAQIGLKSPAQRASTATGEEDLERRPGLGLGEGAPSGAGEEALTSHFTPALVLPGSGPPVEAVPTATKLSREEANAIQYTNGVRQEQQQRVSAIIDRLTKEHRCAEASRPHAQPARGAVHRHASRNRRNRSRSRERFRQRDHRSRSRGQRRWW